jgi:hypothetical protein
LFLYLSIYVYTFFQFKRTIGNLAINNIVLEKDSLGIKKPCEGQSFYLACSSPSLEDSKIMSMVRGLIPPAQANIKNSRLGPRFLPVNQLALVSYLDKQDRDN